MSRFALHCIRVILSFAVCGAIVGMIWKQSYGFITFLSLLSIWLFTHLWQISQLITWLERPKPSNAPSGIGIWQQIFATLTRQAKSRKRRKQKIVQSLQRLYKAFEVMPDGVLILNQDGRIEWMNSVAREHFLLKTEDTGGILANLVRQPSFHQFMDNKDTDEIKLTLPTNKGLSRHVMLKCTDFDKNLQLLVSQDITRIEQINQTRTDFVANVSHELRTPLTVINGFVETMQDYPQLPTEQRIQFLDLMKKDSDRMLALLDDLLTLSRLEATKDSDQLQPIHLSAMVGQLIQEGIILSADKQTFDTEISANIWVKGIQLDLYNALSNLVFNAVRYNHEGGHIQISLEAHDDHTVTFSVTDNGPGIASEHIPRLTERFYRVDTGRSRASGGTGLGLAITKHALAEHGSQLLVESQLGIGSTFSAQFDTIQEPQRVSLLGNIETETTQS
ncbi:MULTISPECIES: phosphate regulon sensor histidine kinase PhoR [Vitreoscilla]|uniref:Phosphate regulon sensor protein PhoR n=1 Tax=Vitreoscilla stercoraria TaxID=61 RepID=A0ABY4EA11_VITST|nr:MULTISPECIES: phosphate regulon sensor histidine kinase PhoR [Vitreoscilla]AUZ06435.2 histidine kinase [Vitreoscilla sp. C1]UOO92282.1 phosphate regulon sensor histidine kinase PhoR [Vitreoscilla stercoraria]